MANSSWLFTGLLILSAWLQGCGRASLQTKVRGVEAFATRTYDGLVIQCYQYPVPGAKQEIVLVHGSPGSAGDFVHQFQTPPPGASLLACDRPGFGDSGFHENVPYIPYQARVLGDVLRARPKLLRVVAGHSYGGPIALKAAIDFPDLLDGVLLVGGAVAPEDAEPMWYNRAADWGGISWMMPTVLAHANREMMSLKGDLDAMRPELARLRLPLVMMQGTRDNIVSMKNVDYLETELAKRGKGALFSKIILSGYNHMIPMEHPEAVNAGVSMVIRNIALQKRIE